jgi:hypothetical protein
MEKENIKTNNWKYWKPILLEALLSAWKESRWVIKSLIIILCVITLTGIAVTLNWLEYPFFKNNLYANTFTGLGQSIISILIVITWFIRFLYQIPPRKDMELKNDIEEKEHALNTLNEQLSNKKIVIDGVTLWVTSDVDTELRLKIKNDSHSTMAVYYALLEKVQFAEEYNEKANDIPKIAENFFHLLWPDENNMFERKEPIAAGDIAILSLAATLHNHNAFGFSTRETDRVNNNFDKPGYYIARVKIGGTFIDIGVTKTIVIVIKYKGGKEIKVIDYWDIQEE